MPGPWDSYAAPAGMPAGYGPAPDFDLKRPKAQAELGQTQASEAHTVLENQRMRAQAPTDAAMARAQLAAAQAGAVVAQQKADEAKANEALATMAPNSQLHGEAYLKKFVPPQMQAVVRAYARGDLGSRSGGLSTSMLPIIQHAMNYDPTASATTFPARAKMQADLAGNQPGTAGGSLRAMEQMVLHGANVLQTGQALDNYGPGILGSIGNSVRTSYMRHADDPTLNAYEQEVKNYAPESQKGVAGSAGGVGEREERAAGYSPSESQASRVAALQTDARMAFERMGAVNDQYKRLMGHDITDALSPTAKVAYDKIMAGGYDAQGKPLYPAAGWTPISGADGGGSSGGAGAGGPSGPSPNDGLSLATGPTRIVNDPKASALVDTLVRKGASADEINAAITPLGYPAVDPARVAQWQTFLSHNPSFKGLAGGGVTKSLPTTALNRISASPLGTGAIAAADSAMGGTLDEGAGLINGIATGQPIGQSIADVNRAKQMAFAANPKASIAGDVIGGTLGYLGAGKLLGGGAAAARLGGYAPYAGAAAFGAGAGFGQNNDNRLGGAALGAIGGVVGQGIGDLAAIPVGAAARGIADSVAGRRLGMMFRGVAPAPKPTRAQAAAMNAISGADPAAIRSTLADAQRLGAPMSLADTAPSIGELAAAAVRRSPNMANLAESTLLPRSRSQFDRLGKAVTRDLGPIANIPQVSADLGAQAKAAAAPLYDAAYAAPGASAVDLSDIINRPLSMKPALSRARSIAEEEGRDPASLGFDLNDHGEVTLTRVPSWQTLDYAKRGLDDILEPHRDQITGKLALNEATRAINNTKNTLLSRVDAINPDYKAARAAYAGPTSSRDALARGQDAYTLDPPELAQQVGAQSPEHLGQMQTGFRSELMNRAGNLRDSTNPWEATLGTPNARERVDTLYPGNNGVADLFRQRELEAQMAGTANRILGNSKTAGRGIADQAFAESSLPSMAVDAALMAHGGAPIATIAKHAATGKLSDMMLLGAGKRAIAKADEIGPLLLNTDPAASAATIDDLIKRQMDYQAYVKASRPKATGMFGAAIGSNLGRAY